MKKVTRYQSDDGFLFETEETALNRDILLDEASVALLHLESPPGSCDGFVQQKGSSVLLCRETAVELSEKECPSPIWRNQLPEKIDALAVSRYLDSTSVAMKLWSRLTCIDEAYREWSQPFFVFNPEKRIMIELKGDK